MDNFYEQLIPTYKTGIYKLLSAFVYIFGFLAAITLSALPIFVVCLMIAVASFFLKKKFYVEYEYVFTNGEIDVDKIVEMKKRSRVITFDIKNVELIAAEDSQYYRDFSNKPDKTITLFPGTNDRRVYVAMLTGGNERVQIRFAPDEEFLSVCFKYNPRAVKKS